MYFLLYQYTSHWMHYDTVFLYNCCFLFIIMELRCKYAPFWQEFSVKSLMLWWPLRPVGLLLLSPLEKDCGSSFQQIWILITLGCFVLSLVEIDPVVLEKKKKMWKVYNNDNNRQWTKLNWAFGSGELKTGLPPIVYPRFIRRSSTHFLICDIHWCFSVEVAAYTTKDLLGLINFQPFRRAAKQYIIRN